MKVTHSHTPIGVPGLIVCSGSQSGTCEAPAQGSLRGPKEESLRPLRVHRVPFLQVMWYCGIKCKLEILEMKTNAWESMPYITTCTLVSFMPSDNGSWRKAEIKLEMYFNYPQALFLVRLIHIEINVCIMSIIKAAQFLFRMMGSILQIKAATCNLYDGVMLHNPGN